MPTYTYKCHNCGCVHSKFSTMNSHRNTSECACGDTATQVILSAPLGYVKSEIRYDSPIDGRPITSRQGRIEDMKRHGCVEYDPEMRKDIERDRAENDARLSAGIRATIEKEIESMPPGKLERLTNELTAGADIDVIRV